MVTASGASPSLRPEHNPQEQHDDGYQHTGHQSQPNTHAYLLPSGEGTKEIGLGFTQKMWFIAHSGAWDTADLASCETRTAEGDRRSFDVTHEASRVGRTIAWKRKPCTTRERPVSCGCGRYGRSEDRSPGVRRAQKPHSVR